MNVKTNSTSIITWDIDLCTAEAIIENNRISSVKVESKVSKENSFTATDEQFLRDTYKAMGELIAHLDKVRGFKKEELSISNQDDKNFRSLLDVIAENSTEHSVLESFSGN